MAIDKEFIYLKRIQGSDSHLSVRACPDNPKQISFCHFASFTQGQFQLDIAQATQLANELLHYIRTSQ